MKKAIIVSYIISLLFFLYGFEKYDEVNKIINNQLEEEVEKIINIMHNHFYSGIKVTYDYEIKESSNYKCFIYKYKAYDNRKLIKAFKKCYNFSKASGSKITLNNEILKLAYLSKINKELESINLMINIYDLPLIEYVILDNEISFIIPREITFDNEVIIKVENQGISEEVEVLRKKKIVALTFDDGPSSKTIEIVNLLNNYNIKATFFILGERVKYFPNELIYIYDNQHEIGNHSFSHPDFKYLSELDALKEVIKTQEVIYEVTKSYPKIFRYPYGSYRLSNDGYINLPKIFWNVDSLDWYYEDENVIFENVIRDLKERSIILFHDNAYYKREALIKVIEYLLKEDYVFVSISNYYNFGIENYIAGRKY